MPNLYILILWLSSSVALLSEEVTEYFLPLDAKISAEPTIYIPVISTSPLLEKRMKLQVGDKIIGLNGKRVSNWRELTFLFKSSGHQNSKPISLHVIRDGKALNLENVIYLQETFKNSIYSSSTGLKNLLLKYGIDQRELLNESPAFDLKEGEELSVHDSHILWGLHGRPLSDIEELLSSDVPQDRSLAIDSIKLYFLMTTEHYQKALKMIGKLEKELDQKKMPFLKDFIGFYKSVAKNPPTKEKFPLSEYGVSADFAAICFPYPLVQLSSGNTPFAYDELFSHQYLKVRHGGKQERDTTVRWPYLPRQSWNTGEDEDKEKAYNYLKFVRAALIDGKSMGGWPYRHADLYKSPSRSSILRGLSKFYEEAPEKRLLISYGLAIVGSIANNPTEMQKGVDYISQFGYREFVSLSEFMDQTHSSWTRKRTRNLWNGLKAVAHAEFPVSGIYKFMEQKSTPLADFVRDGYIQEGNRDVVSVYTYAYQRPWLLYNAIVDPEDVSIPEVKDVAPGQDLSTMRIIGHLRRIKSAYEPFEPFHKVGLAERYYSLDKSGKTMALISKEVANSDPLGASTYGYTAKPFLGYTFTLAKGWKKKGSTSPYKTTKEGSAKLKWEGGTASTSRYMVDPAVVAIPQDSKQPTLYLIKGQVYRVEGGEPDFIPVENERSGWKKL